MKITVNTQKLREALGIASKAAMSKPSMPILACVLIEAVKAENRLHLSGTNLDLGVRLSVPVQSIDENFSVAVNASMLAQIAANVPGEEISLTLAKNSALTVQSERSTFRLLGIDASEFPPVKPEMEGAGIEFTQADLLDRLAAVGCAASRDESRFILNGVYVLNKGGKQCFVATDGRRLHIFEGDGPKDANVSAILPSHAVQRLCALMKSGKVTMWIGERSASFRIEREDGDVFVKTKVVEGNFPNYKQVIPARERFLSFDRMELVSALARVAMVTSDKGGALNVKVEGDTATLTAASPDLGDAKEVIAVGNADNFTGAVGLNPVFILAALDAASGDKVDFSLDEKDPEASAVLVRSGAFRAVVMPVRLT